MKIVSIVGARPEFVQAMPVTNALHRQGYNEVLIHTGQHFDYQMSESFFKDLGLPDPDYNLGVGSGSHASQTGAMLEPLERVLLEEQPDMVIVRGDTNSTLAGALVAAKLFIPLVHIEAGERSFDRRAPEEVNRLIVDRVANLHLCASRTAMRHLTAEGITGTVHWVGDVMLDAISKVAAIAREQSTILTELDLWPKNFCLVTLHRANNTDDPKRLAAVIDALNQVDEHIVFPLHPRTRSAVDRFGLEFKPNIHPVAPVGYLDMVALESAARLIATDSGGVQREAYYLGVPCITLREETEWTETVSTGWNQLVGVDPAQILTAWNTGGVPAERPPIHGDGNAATLIVQCLEDFFIQTGTPDERRI
jgi:UDP-GlcNAc3NAcA epimerase